ncbi:MAG: AAA domain-containing protein [Acidobacteria bacterium]|nr:AAA domain-containing protein [Acidobacteriota bacterium]
MTIQETEQFPREVRKKAIVLIVRVLKFLQEFHRTKTPPIVNLKEQSWKIYLDELPHYSLIQVGTHFEYLKQLFEEESLVEGNFILKIGRPKESHCPPPSVVAENWLKPGWETPGVEPQIHFSKTYKNVVAQTVTEAFDDSPERVEAFEDWLHERKKWEESEINVHDALNVFNEYFHLWSKLHRESEKFQLYVADGIFCWESPQGLIHHPLLIQKVQLEFNSRVPEFVIKDSVDYPTLHSTILRFLGIDGKDISRFQELVSQSHIHPLGGQATTDFLKELVQGLWSDGAFFESAEDVEKTQSPYIYRQPIIYLGHANLGFSDALDKYIQHLSQTDFVPESLVRIVGIDTARFGQPGDADSESSEILLTKAANPEQERVIRQLDETGAVLVQGPPGTGKSHTIANLIGHLLAQNKSILVTSHASKALRVVRELVVPPLQSLCVSLLESDEESSKQLEESVTGIVDYLSRTSPKKINAEIEKLKTKREELKSQFKEIKEAIFNALAHEYRELVLCREEKITPAQAAQQIGRDQEQYSWLPGSVKHQPDLPLTEDEIKSLYEINARLSAEEIELLESSLPDPSQIPTPDKFREVFDSITSLEQENIKKGQGLWRHEDHSAEQLRLLRDKVTQAMAIVDIETPWILECIDVGRRRSEEKKSWQVLGRLVEKLCEEIPVKEELVLSIGPKVKSEKSTEEIIRVCQEICAHLEKGKGLKKLTKLFKPEWKEVIESCQVDDGEPSKADHFQAIINQLEIKMLREELRRRWDRQMEPLSGPPSEKLGRRPEKTARQYIEKIKLAITWFDEIWNPCETLSEEVGLNWKHLLKKAPVSTSAFSDIIRLKEVVTGELQPAIETRIKFIDLKELTEIKQNWFDYFDGLPKREASYVLTKVFRGAVKTGNYDHYLQAYQRLNELVDLKPDCEKRQALLSQLEQFAPDWSAAIAGWQSPHDQGHAPGDIQGAWTHKYLQQSLEKILAADLDELQDKLDSVNEKLQDVTAQYLEKKSWKAQLERTGLKQQQALNGWLALHKKMGKGTGKQVAKLKEVAKKTLLECRQAVPVWIMPISRVLESFDLTTTNFDVLIVDEASQSDIGALAIFALARDVVVVGDHEQVSPYAVGLKTERIQELIDEMLEDIPNKQLYDGKTSIYDLARQSFGGTIRLLEHFRCVPDIIQFSNHLCYNNEILPLREPSASSLFPHLVSHHVPDAVAQNKINHQEAQEIASLILAMCRMHEYEDLSFGVISMVGTDQAVVIDRILRKRLTVSEYKKRRILCGNASQFQGDERDVILLSMVDAPAGRPLPLRQRDEAKKVFNVAASRACDQLWVVHSLRPDRDLKPGDLRYRLIKHAQDPTGLRKKPITKEEVFKSDLQKSIFTELQSRKFQVLLNFEVGMHAIDIVAQSEDRQRLAILCDGDCLKTQEELCFEMDYFMTLRRLDWDIFHLRSSEYYTDPDQTLKRLLSRLDQAGITPRQTEPSEPKEVSPDLYELVKKKANNIRIRWSEPMEPISMEPEKEQEDQTAETA